MQRVCEYAIMMSWSESLTLGRAYYVSTGVCVRDQVILSFMVNISVNFIQNIYKASQALVLLSVKKRATAWDIYMDTYETIYIYYMITYISQKNNIIYTLLHLKEE